MDAKGCADNGKLITNIDSCEGRLNIKGKISSSSPKKNINVAQVKEEVQIPQVYAKIEALKSKIEAKVKAPTGKIDAEVCAPKARIDVKKRRHSSSSSNSSSSCYKIYSEAPQVKLSASDSDD